MKTSAYCCCREGKCSDGKKLEGGQAKRIIQLTVELALKKCIRFTENLNVSN